MRLKLEEEVGYVDTKQEYSSAAGDDQKTSLTTIVEIRATRFGHDAPFDWGNDVLRGMIRCWNYKGCSL
jgi:hypothetical protein